MTLYNPAGALWVAGAVVLMGCSGYLAVLKYWPDAQCVTERLGLGLLISLTLFGSLMLLFGLLGWLSPVSMITVLLLTCVPGAVGLRSALRRRGELQPFDTWERVALWVLVPGLMLVLPMTLLPPGSGDWDGLAYHLSVCAEYLREGRIHYIPWDHHSNFPFLVDMGYLWALATGAGAGAAKLFHWTWGAACGLLLISVARRVGCNQAGAWAITAWLGLPVVIWEHTTSYVDLASAASLTGAALALYVAATGGVRSASGWAVLAGICGAAALGAKMTSLVNIVVLAGLCLLVTRLTPSQRLRLAGLFVLVSLTLAAPWYIKTWLYTGDPVYPFGWSIFHGRNWSEENAAMYRMEQLRFGMGRDAQAALMAPFHMVYQDARFFDPMPFVGSSGMLAVMLVPVMFFVRWPRWTVPVWALIGAGVVAWFIQMQQIRYLFGVLPLAALLVGWLSVHPHVWIRWPMRAALVLQVLVVLLRFGPMSVMAVPVAVGITPHQAFLERSLGSLYRASDWIASHTEPWERVALVDEARGYYVNRPLFWLNPGHHTLIDWAEIYDSDGVLAAFSRHRIRWLLWNTGMGPGDGSTEVWRQRLAQAEAEGVLVERFTAGRVRVLEVVGR